MHVYIVYGIRYTNNELSFSRFILKDKSYEGDKEELKLKFHPLNR